MRAIMESVHANQVTVVKSSNGIGKSFSAACLAIWFYKCFENSQVYVTSAPPLENLKKILWGEIQKKVTRKPMLFAGDKITRLNITRDNNSFITGVAIPTSGTSEQRESKFSGKHAEHIMFIVDEGDAVPFEIYRAIESSMSGGDARLLILFNPRMQAGPVYSMEENKTAHVIVTPAFNHPNVVTGRDLIPGAVNRDTTLRRINEWTRPLLEGESVDTDSYEVPDFLVGTTTEARDGSIYPPLDPGWRKVVQPEFSYMVLARYPAESETQLINEVWINAARKRWDDYVGINGYKAHQPTLGLDVAEYGKDSNVIIARSNDFVEKPILWNGMDVIKTGDRVFDIYNEKDAERLIIDASGVGAGVAPFVNRKAKDSKTPQNVIGVKVAERPQFGYVKTEIGEFFQLRDQLWWAVREWLRTSNAMLPPDELLIQELKVVTYIVNNGKIKVMGKDIIRTLLRRSSDRADALCMTFAPHRRAKILSIESALYNLG
jgi:hypothetical protein